MEILIVLFIAWAFVTVIGHGSWVAIRALVRTTSYQPPPPIALSSEKADCEASERVLKRLQAGGLIDDEMAAALRMRLQDLQLGRVRKTNEAVDAVNPESSTSARFASVDSEVVEAILVDEVEPRTPSLTTAELIASFLAEKNIRWGELVAGILIVVCSIGLVVSLWSTLVHTHRAIPSLIFLTANAAIYAAGFYTLAKWRVRHTSRAVLVIATLLVPLSVLAGLAAVGGGAEAIRLTDPVTLVVIAIAASVYVLLLHRAGKALVRRHVAGAMTLAVAGPACVVPLLPAAIRWFGGQAGWMIAVGSVAVAVAATLLTRGLNVEKLKRLGRAGMRARLIVIGLGLFSLAVAVGYAAFSLRSFDHAGLLAVAVASIPALIAIAGATSVLKISGRSAVGTMIATIAFVICVAATVVILPAAIVAPGWIWAWASAMTVTILIVGWLNRFSPWIACSTLPVGIAAMITSPTLIGNSPWGQIGILNHVLGSLPAFAASLMGLVSASMILLSRPIELRRWMSHTTCLWVGVTAVITGLLAILGFANLQLAIFGGDPLRFGSSFAAASSWFSAGAIALAIVAMRIRARGSAASESSMIDRVVTILIAASAIFWPVVQVAGALPIAAPERVMFATSLLAAAASITSFRFKKVSWIAPVTVAISSIALLSKFWVVPIVHGAHASLVPSVVVVSWWTIAAFALLWLAMKHQKQAVAIGSAVLIGAAAAMLSGTITLHPIQWIQSAALGLIGWAAIMRLASRDRIESLADTIHGSILVALSMAIATAGVAIFAMVLRWPPLMSWLGIPGFVLTLSMVALIFTSRCRNWLRIGEVIPITAWPIAITLLGGQFAWLLESFHAVSTSQANIVIASIALLGAICSLVQSARTIRANVDREATLTTDLIHIGVVALGTTLLTLADVGKVLPGLAMATIALAGASVALIGASAREGQWIERLSRLIGWFVVVAGSWILIEPMFGISDESVAVTFIVTWSACWWIAWRATERVSVSPGPGVVAAISLFAITEIVLTVVDPRGIYPAGFSDLNLLIRLAFYLAIPIVGFALKNRISYRGNLIAISVAAGVLLSVQSSLFFENSLLIRWMIAALSSGFIVTFLAHALPWMATRQSRLRSEDLIRDIWQVAILTTAFGIGSSLMMIFDNSVSWVAQLTILTVAMSAWTFAVLAETSSQDRWRYTAIGLAMTTMGLLASTSSTVVAHPILEATMRWLVASVIAIPTWLFLFPKLLGTTITTRWSPAFRAGAAIAAVTAVGSLAAMLVIEGVLREGGRIDELSRSMVVGVAVTLAILSGIAGLVAILTPPGSQRQERLKLSDRTRQGLIVASQMIAALTVLHLVLCKRPESLHFLRAYWPMIVMGLAFISVGVTEWARRRGDRVISETLKQTSLYLPLVPVFGFWLSNALLREGAVGQSWNFFGGDLRYDLMLVLAAIYYVAISALWKSAIPRVAALVLGNAALWVMLVQQPGWGFLSHPQVWLIPPAVCLLAVSHFYRDRLDRAMLSSIRYAATLVIYISSTADILLQQIGASLSGPIVLILLALIGMLAGVALRIGPFLYLGATFVFVGVTSMVWHAGRSIDAVWPWWVFGITTGMLLLVALTFLEKNKSKLRMYAASLNG